MNDRVSPSLQEVWNWKRQDEAATQSMNRLQLIEYYRSAADAVEEKLGLNLKARPARDARDRAQPSGG